MKLYSCVFAATTAVAHGVSVQEYVQAHAVRALAVAKNAATLVENKRRLQVCNDACGWFNFDGNCDDGGPGSDYSICSPGTDDSDCLDECDGVPPSDPSENPSDPFPDPSDPWDPFPDPSTPSPPSQGSPLDDITGPNDLNGILVEFLPTACGTSEVNAMCGIYSDFSGLVSSATCRTTVGIDLTPDLSKALTVGLNCLNVMLCSRGNANTCFNEALALAQDPENNIGEGLENIGNINIDDPVAFLTDACDNGCYTRLANTIVGGYEFAQDENGAACLAALGDEDSPIPGMENPLPEVPSMDDVDLGLDFDLETYADEAVNFMQNACQRNAAGNYCVEVLANVWGGDESEYYDTDYDYYDDASGCPSLEEAGEVCPIMEDLGCCASVILTNPFIEVNAADRTCILNYGSEVCGIEQSLARPCTAGLATPVVIIESSTTLPACPHDLCVNEQPVDEPTTSNRRMLNEDSVDETAFTAVVADAIGVDPGAIIITAVTVNEDMTTTVDYQVILKGTAAAASAANVEAIIADDTFTTTIASAAGVDAAAVVNTPPVVESIAPDTGGDESESNVAVIAGGVVGAVLVVGAVVGGVLYAYKSRGSQQAASRAEGVDMSQQQKSDIANQF